MRGASPQAGEEAISYYHTDGLGSITNLTNSVGQSVQSYQYDAFGNMLSSLGNISNSYAYTARELDSETGLYYYRNRYYDPQIGRFITQDPIGILNDINLYAYVGNSPVNFVDPWGFGAQKRWWQKIEDKFKEFFGVEPPKNAVYFNLFLHSSVTVIRNGEKRIYGFGPDPERMFPWQTPPSEKTYIWPFRSPGVVVEDIGIGIPILTTKDPQKAKEIAEGIKIAKEQSPGTNYSIAGVECIIWAIGASEGNFPKGQRNQ